MNKKELIIMIAALVGLMVTCLGGYSWLNAEFAHATDMKAVVESVKRLAVRLDYKIVEDQLRSTQQKIWNIEDRYCPDKSKPCDESKMPQTVRDEYRELKVEKEKLQNELKILQEKK